MLRATLSSISKQARSFLPQGPSLLYRPHFSFSGPVNHPTIEKILKSQQPNALLEAIPQIGGLGEKNRELALKIILSKIFSGKASPSLLDNPKLTSQLAKHSEMMLEALLFRIKELMKSLGDPSQASSRSSVFNSINDHFLQCFSALKKVSGPASTRYEIMLHKRFADYNLLYLSKSVQEKERNSILEKSRQFYHSTLIKMAVLINEEQEKFKKASNIKADTPEKAEEEEMKANAVKQNIRMLIQTNSENMLHIFMVEKQLSKKQQHQLPQNIIGLLPYFQKSIAYYQIFAKMTAYSIFYHRIRKLALQINYYSKVNAFRKFNPSPLDRRHNEGKLWEELGQQLDKLYEETIEDIKVILKEPKHMGNLQQMTLLLLNIRVHKSMRKEWKGDECKHFLMQEVGNILQLITDPDERKTITFHLSKVVKQMLEEKGRQK